MTDYKSIWIKWIAFLNIDPEFRNNILESLHKEVISGFSVIARIGAEELEARLKDTQVFKAIKNDLDQLFLHSVWAGYALFLISEGVDPKEENLATKEKTNELGNKWMENYTKDQNNNFLKKIDPVLSIFVEKQTQIQMNELFTKHPLIQKEAYVNVSQVEKFLNWATYQGFIFGLIESELNVKNHP